MVSPKFQDGRRLCYPSIRFGKKKLTGLHVFNVIRLKGEVISLQESSWKSFIFFSFGV